MIRRWGTASRCWSSALALVVVAMTGLMAPPANASAPRAYSATVVSDPSSVASGILGISETGWISGYEYNAAYTATLLVGKASDIHRVTFSPGADIGASRPNASGQLTVSVRDPDASTYHLAVLNADGTTTEPPLNPAWNIESAGLDDSGVAAAAIDVDGCWCRWTFGLIDTTSGAVTVLDAAAADTIAPTARANGWSVGYKVQGSTLTPVAWQDNGVAHVIAPPSDSNEPSAIAYQPSDVNAAGTTVGNAYSYDGSRPRGFVWRPDGQPTFLDPGTYQGALASGVSASGLVSGVVWKVSVDSDGAEHAYDITPGIWEGGVLRTYPENKCAAFGDINDHYDVVGVSYENQTTVATVFAPRRARLADALTILPHRCDGTSLLGDLGLPVELF